MTDAVIELKKPYASLAMGVLFFGGCGYFLFDRASTNDRGLIINGIIHLTDRVVPYADILVVGTAGTGSRAFVQLSTRSGTVINIPGRWLPDGWPADVLAREIVRRMRVWNEGRDVAVDRRRRATYRPNDASFHQIVERFVRTYSSRGFPVWRDVSVKTRAGAENRGSASRRMKAGSQGVRTLVLRIPTARRRTSTPSP